MDTAVQLPATSRYAQCIEASRRVRWDIDRDVIRGRAFDYRKKFLPDRLARIEQFAFATPAEKRYLSQIQGRTYANMFGLVERFIGSKLVEIAHPHALGDQVVFESLVRFTDEELKHQELFRRLEEMMAADMPVGYAFLPAPYDVAEVVLRRSTWAVLGLTCNIELFTLDHYRQSIDKDPEVSELWRDVFLHHMREEAQHAILDEMEWLRENLKLGPAQRDRAVGDLIDLVGAVDALLRMQADADASYFLRTCGRELREAEEQQLRQGLLRAEHVAEDRHEALVAHARHDVLPAVGPQQMQRVVSSLQPIVDDTGSVQ